MFPPEIFRVTLEKLTGILQARQIRFHLTGGVTSATYGEPRLTQDIDVVVDPVPLRPIMDSVFHDFSRVGLLFEPTVARHAIQFGSMFQLLDAAEALKLDVYPRELIPGELDRSSLTEVFAGVTLPIVSRTDAAAAKLIWIHQGSHKSRRDLRQLFRTSNSTDQETIRKLANDLKLSELLETVLAEQDQIG